MPKPKTEKQKPLNIKPLEIRTMEVKRLKAAAYNPRDIKATAFNGLRASVEKFGLPEPIVWNRRSNRIVGGHQRLRVLIDGGVKRTEVSVVDLDANDEKALNLALNNPGIQGQFTAAVGEIVAGLKLALPNLHQALLLDSILVGTGQLKQGATDPDDVPAVPAKPVTRKGDLWVMGDHRLLCGDSTKTKDTTRIMGKEKAIGCVTSPPYAEQRKEQYGGIKAEKYQEWFSKVQDGAHSLLSSRGNLFLNIKPHAARQCRHLYVFDLVCSMVREWRWLFVDEYCWLRTGIPQQVVNRFKNAFEPIYWFAKSRDFVFYPEAVRHESDAVPLALGPGAGDTNAARRQGKKGGAIQGNKIVSGMAYPSNVLNFKQNAAAVGHPAAYPVKLPSFFVQAYSVSGEIWYEPFAGSGSTMIACEQLGRRCYAIEIEPRYCDVTVRRWEEFTGKKATRQKA